MHGCACWTAPSRPTKWKATSSPTTASRNSIRSTTRRVAPARLAAGVSGRLSSPAMKRRRPDMANSKLNVSGLQKTYGARQVVRDVSLYVESGQVVGLLGPNGAGKTTSFYMIVGLVPSDAGE